MKDIPTDELAAISPELHEAATRVGCEHVSVTGQIYPGGQLTGPSEKGARFVEYSWLRAAVINGSAVFEDNDPAAFTALLREYGLEEDPYPLPVPEAAPEENPGTPEAPVAEPKATLTLQIQPATMQELERQAKAAGITIGEFLDWKFQAPPP